MNRVTALSRRLLDNSKSRWIILRRQITWERILAFVIVVIPITSIFSFYMFREILWPGGVGFAEYTGPLTKDQRGKTLWDWLQLLVVPVVLAVAAYWFNNRQRANEIKIADDRRKNDLEIANNRNHEAMLQNYLDKMTELMLEENSRETTTVLESLAEDDLDKTWRNKQNAAKQMAQIRTATILRELDTDRKNIILQFLRDTALDYFILVSAFFQNADLRKTNFIGLNLSKANLREANLSEANLRDTNLSEANLSEADLSEANLIQANLIDTTLYRANLNGAFLTGAIVSDEQLSETNFLKGTTMPDGTIHE